tara:strand:- start:948 stop:1136 length:189 start_codon:yes stop_codon:yes gene_type:complete
MPENKLKIKVMNNQEKVNLVIDLWVGLNGGYITTNEYKEMIELQNLDDGSQSDHEMANESNC